MTEKPYRIEIDRDAVVTDQAVDIVERLAPEFLLGFLDKNRKYRAVDNSLGSKGVFPDINRKTGILKSRIWDGDASVGESTREVAMDLIGHLFLMIHMMDEEDAKSPDDEAELIAGRLAYLGTMNSSPGWSQARVMKDSPQA